MGEQETSSSAKGEFQKDAECLCSTMRKAFRDAANAFLPPEEARKHFRQARVEVWKGVRELVDQRIAHLNRQDTAKGTQIVVE